MASDYQPDPYGTLAMIREMIKDGAPKRQMYEYINREITARAPKRDESEAGKQLDKELRAALSGRDGWLSTYPANVIRFSENRPNSKAAINVEPVTVYPRAAP